MSPTYSGSTKDSEPRVVVSHADIGGERTSSEKSENAMREIRESFYVEGMWHILTQEVPDEKSITS